MNPQSVLSMPIDDIVFEGRNKSYGAYYLRQIYEKHLKRSLIAGLIFFISMAAAPTFARYLGKKMIKDDVLTVVEVNTMNLKQPEDEKKVIPPPIKQEEPPPMKATQRFVAPEPVIDEKVINEEPPPPLESLQATDISNKTQEGSKDGVSQDLLPDEKTETPPPAIIEDKPKEEDKPFVIVEQMPEFEGGQAALFKFLSDNIKYPTIAKENGISGRVVLKFVVNEDGTISQIQTLKGVNSALDEEAERVVKLMSGKWIAGKQRGKAVKVFFTLPVSFKLEN